MTSPLTFDVDAAAVDAASEDTASLDAASEDAAVLDAASEDAASLDAASEDAASLDVASLEADASDEALEAEAFELAGAPDEQPKAAASANAHTPAMINGLNSCLVFIETPFSCNMNSWYHARRFQKGTMV